MKPIWVATLNAGKFKTVLQIVKNFGLVLLTSLLLFTLSCDKGDDLETIGNKPPPDIVSPPVNVTPPPNETPTDDESNIVYTDIEPDFTSENLNDSYNLDLNNDQIVDFTITSGSGVSGGWVLIISSHCVEMNGEYIFTLCGDGIVAINSWYTYVVPLNSDEVIYQNISYELGGKFAIGECFASEPSCGYDWKNKGDKYLGLRFSIKGQTYYGWARLDVTSGIHWVIKDYAYNATPNKPILAGQRE